MTRGNQRAQAREKNLKKQQDTKKPKDELPLEKKKERDVAALQEKQKKSVAMKSQDNKETKTTLKKTAKGK